MTATTKPAIITAAEKKTVLEAACDYAHMGLSVLPLHGKRPSVNEWKSYQAQRAVDAVIRGWGSSGKLQNVGIVCGKVSGNLVVLDLDGAAGYPAFAAQFPDLAETYTVASGGGVGKHVYWKVDDLPLPIKAMDSPIGNLEICAEGRQVVAPPSVYPVRKQKYTIHKPLDILHVKDLKKLTESQQARLKRARPFAAQRGLLN
ncbi:MAG: bifunctional DNA primase/polymerase [Anaerolineales bacterium]